MNTISAKVEKAFASVITGIGQQNLSIYVGLDDAEKEAPCVIIATDSVADEAPNLGVWRVKLNLAVKTIAADTDEDASSNLAQTIFETVTDDSIKDLLAAAIPDLAVYEVILVASSEDTDGDAWIQSLGLEVVCVHNS